MRKLCLGMMAQSKGVIALCDQGVLSLTSFLTGMMIGRLSGSSELGLYALAWILLTNTTGLLGTLIATPYTVFGPQMGRGERKYYLGSLLVQQIAMSVMLAAIILIGATVASLRGASDAVTHVMIATAAVIVFTSLREFGRAIWFAELRMGSTAMLDAAGCIAQILSLVALSYATRLSACSALVVLGVVSAALTFTWLHLSHKELCFRWRECIPTFRRNWGFGKWVLTSGLSWSAAVSLYPWFLTLFHGTATTGIWAACNAVVGIGTPVLQGFTNYVGPKAAIIYAHEGLAAMRVYVGRACIACAVLLLPLVIVLVLFGGKLVTRLYGEAFHGNAVLITLLALNLLGTAIASPLSRGLFAVQAARADALVNFVAIALLFTFGIAAVKLFSTTGASAALLLSTLTTVVIRASIFEAVTRVGVSPKAVETLDELQAVGIAPQIQH